MIYIVISNHFQCFGKVINNCMGRAAMLGSWELCDTCNLRALALCTVVQPENGARSARSDRLIGTRIF